MQPKRRLYPLTLHGWARRLRDGLLKAFGRCMMGCKQMAGGRGASSRFADGLSSVGHIVFIRPDRIGDAVLATPCYRMIKDKWPRCRVTVIGSKAAKPLIAGLESVDAYIGVRNDTFGAFLQARAELKNLKKEKPDGVIALEMRWAVALLARWLGGSRSVGYDVKGMGWLFGYPVVYPYLEKKEHQVRVNSALLQAAGLPEAAEPPSPEVVRTPQLAQEAASWVQHHMPNANGKRILVHPGSRLKTTRWPLEKYAELVGALTRRTGCRVALLAGPEEVPLTEALNALCGGGCPIIQGLPLKALPEWLAQFDLFIGNSTGTLHVGAVVCPRVLGIIGASHPQGCPERWGPWGRSHAVAHTAPETVLGRDTCEWREAEGLEYISVEAVLAAAEAALEDL